jgi:hypothetical protein
MADRSTETHVPEYDSIEFTHHALERMQERRLSEEDIRHILRFGEGRPGRRGMWLYEMRAASGAGTRVVVKEFGLSARVITVMRLRKRS